MNYERLLEGKKALITAGADGIGGGGLGGAAAGVAWCDGAVC